MCVYCKNYPRSLPRVSWLPPGSLLQPPGTSQDPPGAIPGASRSPLREPLGVLLGAHRTLPGPPGSPSQPPGASQSLARACRTLPGASQSPPAESSPESSRHLPASPSASRRLSAAPSVSRSLPARPGGSRRVRAAAGGPAPPCASRRLPGRPSASWRLPRRLPAAPAGASQQHPAALPRASRWRLPAPASSASLRLEMCDSTSCRARPC